MWVFRPPVGDGTTFIILCFIFIAYILHPMVATALERIRANVGWWAIKHRRQSIEVTNYSLQAEILGDRGNWAVARVTTLMLATFSALSLGLDLSVDLAFFTDGPVDLFNRPPPVLEGGVDEDWVITRVDNDTAEQGRTLGNFEDQSGIGKAVGLYRIGDRIIVGKTVIARWSSTFSSESTPELYYNSEMHSVKDINCTGEPIRSGKVLLGDDVNPWGEVTECVNGPALSSRPGVESPPTILLRSNDLNGGTYLIIEEDTSYPSFTYSVWRGWESTTLHPIFYISSSYRLVEAIVTGIVNGVKSDGSDETMGGDCFKLLTYWSWKNQYYPQGVRISPFGEHPGNFTDAVEHLDDVENIEAGVKVRYSTVVFGIFLFALSTIAIFGSLFPSNSPVDMYNPYELIDRLYVPLDQNRRGDSESGILRIFVEHDKENEIIVEVIKDVGKRNGWDRLHYEAAKLGFCWPGLSHAASTRNMWLTPMQDLRATSDDDRIPFSLTDRSTSKMSGAQRGGALNFSRLTKGRVFPSYVRSDHGAVVGDITNATASTCPIVVEATVGYGKQNITLPV